jgi:hypothetical protein
MPVTTGGSILPDAAYKRVVEDDEMKLPSTRLLLPSCRIALILIDNRVSEERSTNADNINQNVQVCVPQWSSSHR